MEEFYLRPIELLSGVCRRTSDDVEMTDAAGQVAILGFLARTADLQAQVVQRIGVAQGILVTDLAGFVQFEKRLVEGLHPELRDFFMISFDLPTSPLKMRSEIRGELSMISTAATRPLPSFLAIRRCETMARRLSERSISNCERRVFREEVDDAVDRRVGAVGAASPAPGDQFRRRRSRSPSCRGHDFTHENDIRRLAQRVLQGHFQSSVSTPTSRCVMMQFLCS